MNEFLLFLTGVVGVLVAVVSLLHYRFISHLKVHHIECWNRLGSPELIQLRSVTSDTSLFGFVLRGQYKKLNGALLTRTGSDLRIGHLLLIGVIIVSVVNVVGIVVNA